VAISRQSCTRLGKYRAGLELITAICSINLWLVHKLTNLLAFPAASRHNFNLLHAHEGEEYLDYTGYMGGAIISYHDRTGFPAMCFNAANHWQLGWFQDRAIETDLFTPTLVRLAAFVDYDKTTQGLDNVVLRSGNVFMHYNRAKGTNVDTYEYKDHLVIYQNTRDGSYLFAALSYPEKTLYKRSFPQGTWRAEICDKVEGNLYTPDYLIISVGFGESSLCSKQLGDQSSNDGDSVSQIKVSQGSTNLSKEQKKQLRQAKRQQRANR